MNEQHAAGSDEEVIADSIGDPSLFGLLFDRHYDQVWRYVCRRCGATVADELASEVFVRALAGRSARSRRDECSRMALRDRYEPVARAFSLGGSPLACVRSRGPADGDVR
jgi:DNA-directed RNA polymerase specialized sigma24 family protein